MPELPEVETVARHLQRILPNRTIEQAIVTRATLLEESTPEAFCARLQGVTFTEIGRRGKHLLLHLSSNDTLITHLRMTGRFLYLDRDATPLKHTHARFFLDNGKQLAFDDQRHFGRMHLVKSSEVADTREIRDLAPEPLGPEFTLAYLKQTLAKSSRDMKELLLDQTKVLGLGNIYAVEALFAARIHPETPANLVPASKIKDLYEAIRAILEAAIEAGSTIQTDPEVIDGSYFGNSFEEALVVYDHEGEPCIRCDSPISRIRQGQRSTYFCPKCQKAPKKKD